MIELNKIYCEDNLVTMGRMPDGFIDLTVTSPPYDNLRKYNGFKWEFEKISKELFRVTKKGGVLVWVVGDGTEDGSESGSSFMQALHFKECGFKLHDTMIYAKNSIPLTHKRYEQVFEYMFVLVKGKIKTFNALKEKTQYAGIIKKYDYVTATTKEPAAVRSGMNRSYKINEMKYRANIWFYAVGADCSSKDDIAFDHPAIFPELLVADHLLSWSNERDVIYDPFMGSGTVAKMAHILNRNWVGSEISKEYCDLAEKRIAPYLNQTSLFP